ncbi:MAG: GGDEF domain-containing protein, partial [Deltaproteobacteria bacterium]
AWGGRKKEGGIMDQGISGSLTKAFGAVHNFLGRPEPWAFLPAFLLGGYWLTNENFLLFFALCSPALLVLARTQTARSVAPGTVVRGIPDRGALIERLGQVMNDSAKGRSEYACFVLELDRMSELSQSYGPGVLRDTIDLAIYRLSQVTRRGDMLARLDESRVALLTAPLRSADPDTLMQIADRCQTAVGQPAVLDNIRLDLTMSIGFATPRMPLLKTPGAVLDAAERALVEARRIGSGAVRAHDPKNDGLVYEETRLSNEILPAIATGQIVAVYQPIVDTDSGTIAAMDVTPMWEHPDLGRISWGEFRVAAITSGQSAELRLAVLRHALNSLRSWRAAGFTVPRLQLALGNLELADPKLGERLLWELDRFDFGPDMLSIAVKESSVTRQVDEMVYANLRRLSGLGFGLTVTGFGTGSTSMNILRHIGVTDLRIDRSFVINVDVDEDQRRLLNAILQMADALNVRILADGVDSISEHSMLAQLGCDCVQGLAISAAMPFVDTPHWLSRHQSKVTLGRVSAG